MLTDYGPVLLLFGVILAFAVVNIFVSELLGGRSSNKAKTTAYECGLAPEGNARIRLSIHFYLVAVLFILFDVESLFLVLWAATARTFAEAGRGPLVFAEVAVFVGVLVVALAWVWRKGGLEWDR
ncbi:MAG: NADH-quinone oxidoreductase subunit A [Planctomycetota bacterium]|jgi:NADH-quinone oxidoreductase subunit A|nr:NADH-quinone oxidoreductase subunit A [Planctomycetota bacterium]MDP6520620.1 NADH-quinone oxidoreductase subunit A [Planctomycetota bacterium]MDP6837975.1 NADH-quinone oxidoreductase subunit A [Planctomycetota bacterium]MDP6954363.1 NADH-quinone oxidoreductase subunit A [Planctomycetota bacterium]